MSELFRAKRGSVSVETMSGPSFMKIEGIDGLSSSSVIVTSASMTRSEAMHYIKSLGGPVYTYAFGEAPGASTVSGIIFFQNSCGGGGGGSPIASVNRWYEQRRAYNSSGPITMSIGGAAFRAAIVGMNITAPGGEAPIANFTITYTIIPIQSSGGSGGL